MLHIINRDYVHYNSESYLHGDMGYYQDPYVTLITRKGDCKAYAMLFLTIMRAVYGVSPKFVVIHIEGDEYHALVEWEDTFYDLTWNEVYPESQFGVIHPSYSVDQKYTYDDAISMINFQEDEQ